MTLREQINAAPSRREEIVTVEEWDNLPIHVREMSSTDSMNLGKFSGNHTAFNGALLAYSIVDDAGALVYGTDTVHELLDKGHTKIEPLIAAAYRVNGFDKETVKKA